MRQSLTINEAILTVMREAKTPLSAHEAYDRIVAQNLYQFHAQQPENVVKGQIRRHCKDLFFPTAEPVKYFGMTSEGRFYPLDTVIRPKKERRCEAVTYRPQKVTVATTFRQLKDLHALHKELIKESILRDLKLISPEAFEHFAKRLLEVYGFENMKVTAISRDGGIDGYGRLKVGLAHMGVAFQCKRWTQTNVGRPEIDKFRGAIQGEYEQGIFFTTAGFAPGAKDVSFRRGAVPIILIDGPAIADMMIERGFGVEQETLPVYSYALDLVLTNETSTTK